MINVKNIWEGWKNHLLPEENKKAFIKHVSKSRLAICEVCEEHSSKHKTVRLDIHCNNCGCTLSAKTKCLTCECPLNKWGAQSLPDETT